MVPVKTTATGGFRFEARSGTPGSLLWSATSDYVVPPHNWFPSYNLTLTAAGRVYAPGAGGKLYYRDDVDSATGTVQTAVFYGSGTYAAAPATYDAAVTINTPLTKTAPAMCTSASSQLRTPAGVASGFARVTATGTGTWISATAAANDAGIDRPAMNSAPAISRDGAVVYVAVTNAQGSGYLLGLDSVTLTPLARRGIARSHHRRERVHQPGWHRVTHRGSRWRRIFRRAGIQSPRAQLPRLVAALQRRADTDEDSRRVRLG